MSLFEFVLAFSSVISALALGHVLAGAAHLLRRRARVRFSLTHALWMWSMMALVMGNWAPQRLLPAWRPTFWSRRARLGQLKPSRA